MRTMNKIFRTDADEQLRIVADAVPVPGGYAAEAVVMRPSRFGEGECEAFRDSSMGCLCWSDPEEAIDCALELALHVVEHEPYRLKG